MTGGDTRRAQDHGTWASTVGPAASWRIIRRRGLLPLYMVLEQNLRDKVRAILEAIDPQLVPETLQADEPRAVAPYQAVRADHDGFLVARVSAAPVPSGRFVSWMAASGPADVPRGTQAVASVWRGTDISVGLDFQTIPLPVRRRDVMIVEQLRDPMQEPRGTAPATRWYETVYLDEAFFDPFESIEFFDERQKTTEAVYRFGEKTFSVDGFLVLWASCGGARGGSVRCRGWRPGGLEAGAS